MLDLGRERDVQVRGIGSDIGGHLLIVIRRQDDILEPPDDGVERLYVGPVRQAQAHREPFLRQPVEKIADGDLGAEPAVAEEKERSGGENGQAGCLNKPPTVLANSLRSEVREVVGFTFRRSRGARAGIRENETASEAMRAEVMTRASGR